jgi:hypothetical protein
VFEDRVLRSIFGPKEDKMIGGWRILGNEELHYSYFSINVIRMTSSRMMIRTGHVACMGEKRNAYRI